MATAELVEGMVLTCTHNCGCKIVIQSACCCETQPGATYTCACGTPMVPVDSDTPGHDHDHGDHGHCH